METLEKKLLDNIPEIEFIKERFNFIDNETLRTNLAISLKYIIFLFTIEKEISLPGPITYSLFKNIILHTASIVEGSLHYTLDTLIKRKKLDLKEVMPKEDNYSNKKVLYITEDETQICGIHYKKKLLKLKSNTNFIDINRACKKGNILSESLFQKVEKLREKRNKIHLAGLSEIDDYYKKSDINEAFEITKLVLDVIENKLRGD